MLLLDNLRSGSEDAGAFLTGKNKKRSFFSLFVLSLSEILDMAREMGEDLHKAGVIDKITKRQIDTLCLPNARVFKPVEIRRIRNRNRVSQAVFASVLGIGKTTVQHWEQGVKKPSGPARRLIDLVDRKGLSVFG